MGEGIKLLEADRPSVASIYKRLDDRISSPLKNLFLTDIQNDCSCNTEIYDCESQEGVFYLSKEGIEEFPLQTRLPLYMKDDISEIEVWNLIRSACAKASDTDMNQSYNHMLFNPKSDIIKVKKKFENWINPFAYDRAGNPKGWISVNFVPENYVYLIPYSEFFGVISANIDKFGAMCFGKNIFKVKL